MNKNHSSKINMFEVYVIPNFTIGGRIIKCNKTLTLLEFFLIICWGSFILLEVFEKVQIYYKLQTYYKIWQILDTQISYLLPHNRHFLQLKGIRTYIWEDHTRTIFPHFFLLLCLPYTFYPFMKWHFRHWLRLRFFSTP